MNVAELQKYLRDLSDFVEGAGGKRVADDIRAAADAFRPFAGRTVRQFADFLAKAEEYDRTGQLAAPPAPARKKAVKVNPEEVADRVKKLYDRVLDPTVSSEEVEQTLQPLDALTKDGLLTVALALGLPPGLKSKTKPVLTEVIRSTVRDRRDMHRRMDQ